jgi:hypothetical protein
MALTESKRSLLITSPFCDFMLSDTTLERNFLMENVYPKIKEYCRERHGLEFQVIARCLPL